MTKAWKLGRNAQDRSSGVRPTWQRTQEKISHCPDTIPSAQRRRRTCGRGTCRGDSTPPFDLKSTDTLEDLPSTAVCRALSGTLCSDV